MRHQPRQREKLSAGRLGDQAVLLLFGATLLGSAALLFSVEPMFAKKVLPLLGGTPAVWNTCLVFYQTVLLIGYLYAHVTTRRLGARRQAALHLVMLLLPWFVLPIGRAGGWTPPVDSNPIPWLLGLLTVSVGLPFFVVSASAPMLQAWFAETGHPAAKDPYFLYGASNLGSMVGLLGYPLAIEPRLRLSEQAVFWSIGYGVLAALTAACAVVLWRHGAAGRVAARGPSQALEAATRQGRPAPAPVAASPTRGRRLRWLLLALAPSSLLLGVTSHISTDIAVVPLLWVVPLALYLLSFVLAFARRPVLKHSWMLAAEPLLVALAALLYYHTDRSAFWLEILLQLGAFFVIAMVCHGELARSRPDPRYLTEFYIWISLGGMLGGWFNALLAPLIFPVVLEYPLMIVVACLLRPPIGPRETSRRARRMDLVLPAVFAAAFSGLVYRLAVLPNYTPVSATARNLMDWAAFVLLVVAVVIAWMFRKRPLRFALGVAALVLLSGVYFPQAGLVIAVRRNFFGVLRLSYASRYDAICLVHGTTNHGMQSCDPQLKQEPLSYYYRSGPIGEVFDAARARRIERVGVVGLGTGTMACYGRPGERWTFYEINPLVAEFARDKNRFTFLADSKADWEIALGDARLSLARAAEGEFDLLCLDAFSSDTIPLHLVTREAIRLYFRKLKPGGILAIHISNKYLDLAPPLANIAAAEGLECRLRQSDPIPAKEEFQGKLSNSWLVMARRPEDLGQLAGNPKWRRRGPDPAAPLWTDDFSDILSVMTWRR